ncbi:MAG: DUF58 domain-containing protein [Thermoplasmata archaeon]|nr:DUF58 domain-containing protein [Thermoplasmata archaeon]
MNPRNLFAFTGLFLIFLAVILRTTAPLFFTVFLFSVLFLSYILRPKVEIEPAITQDRTEWFQNEKIKMKLKIKNKGAGSVLGISISALDIFKVSVDPSVIALKPGETRNLDVTVRARIPARLKVLNLKVSASDPLGFYRFEKNYELGVNLRILPILEDVRKAKLVPAQTRGIVGNVVSRVRGSGLEFHSLREYQSGDTMKVINWKASARYSRLIARQFNVERSGDVVLCVDLRKGSYLMEEREKIQTRMISAAFSLATKIVTNRDRVGAIVIADTVRYIMPGYGKKQIYRILELLMHQRGGDDAPVENLEFILPRLFRTNALFVVFTPLMDEELPRVLIETAGRGFKIVCISPDPLDYIQKGEKRETVIVRGVLGLRRKSLIASISRYMEIVNWKSDISLTAVLRGVKAYRERVSL